MRYDDCRDCGYCYCMYLLIANIEAKLSVTNPVGTVDVVPLFFSFAPSNTCGMRNLNLIRHEGIVSLEMRANTLTRIILSGKYHSSFRRCYLTLSDWNYVGKPSQSQLSSWIDRYLSIANTKERKLICTNNILEGSNVLSTEKEAVLAEALASCKHSISFAMVLRSDVLELIRANSGKANFSFDNKHSAQSHSLSTQSADGLQVLDTILSKWLAAVMCQDAIVLRRVLFEECSGTVLERVTSGEAVHRIRALSTLKSRLSNGRRCFMLIHPRSVSAPENIPCRLD